MKRKGKDMNNSERAAWLAGLELVRDWREKNEKGATNS